jgi:hypothetical protein
MGRSGATPVFLVELDLSTEVTTKVFKFISTERSVLTYPASVSSIGSLSSKVNPIKRTSSMGEVSIVFIDDGVLRGILSENRFKSKKVTVSVGESSLEEADFAPYFVGTFRDIKPRDTYLEIITENVFSLLKDQKLFNQTFAMMHPLQIIERVFEKAQLHSSFYDSSTYDPDNYSDSISHWNICRGGYNLAGKGSKIDNKDCMSVVNELAFLMQGTLVPHENGELNFTLYDPDAAALDSWGADDISDFKQDQAIQKYYNKVLINFQYEKDGDTYQVSITHTNNDSVAQTAWPEAAEKELVLDIDSQWLNAVCKLHAPFLENATELDLSGLTMNCFAGMRQVNGVVPASGAVSSDRLAHILIREFYKGFLHPSTTETVEADGSAVDLQYYACGNDILYSDEDATVNNATSVSLRCTYSISPNGRKYFSGGSATGVTFAEDYESVEKFFAFDVTIPVYLCRRLVERLSEGLGIISLNTNLSKYALQIGDMVTITEPIYLNFGADGATVDKWEIISKSTDVKGGRIKWKLARVYSNDGYDESWTPTFVEPGQPGDTVDEGGGSTDTPAINTWLDVFNDIGNIWDSNGDFFVADAGFISGPSSSDYAASSVTPSTLAYNPGSMTLTSWGAPLSYINSAFFSDLGDRITTLPANSVITIGKDAYTGLTIFSVDNDKLGASALPVETVTTGASGITDVTPIIAKTGAVLGKRIQGFPGFHGTSSEFPYWENPGGFFWNTTDNIALVSAPEGFDTYAEIVIAQSPYVYYRFEETGFEDDSSGNGRTGSLAGSGPLFAATGGLIRSAGAVVGLCAHFNDDTDSSGVIGSMYREEVDTTTSIGWSVSCWLGNFTVAATHQVIFSGAEQTGTAAGDDVIKIVQDTSDNEFSVTINQTTVTFTNAALGMNLGDGDSHHLVVTWDATTDEVDVWIDGILRGYTLLAATMDKEVTLAFGCEVDNAGAFSIVNYWDGLVDEFGYWSDKVLTTDEIIAQHTAGGINFAGAGPAYTPLVNTHTTASEMGLTADDISETSTRKFLSANPNLRTSVYAKLDADETIVDPDTTTYQYFRPSWTIQSAEGGDSWFPAAAWDDTAKTFVCVETGMYTVNIQIAWCFEGTPDWEFPIRFTCTLSDGDSGATIADGGSFYLERLEKFTVGTSDKQATFTQMINVTKRFEAGQSLFTYLYINSSEQPRPDITVRGGAVPYSWFAVTRIY